MLTSVRAAEVDQVDIFVTAEDFSVLKSQDSLSLCPRADLLTPAQMINKQSNLSSKLWLVGKKKKKNLLGIMNPSIGLGSHR